MSRAATGTLSGLAAAGIWGGMYVVSKAILDIIPPFSLITCRLVLGVLTLAILWLPRRGRAIPAGVFWRIFGVGAIGYGISLGFQFVGTKLSTAGNGSLVTSATPAFVLVIAWVLLGESITRSRLLAVAVSTLGVVAVIDPRSARLDASLFWGNISLLAAAITWALYSVLVRRVTRDVDVLTVSLIAFLGGLPVAVPGSIPELNSIAFTSIGPSVILGILFLGIISTALAMYMWNTAFAILDAGRASLTFFAQPVVGTLLGWWFLHEAISPLFLVGAALIALGLILASR
jgi:drug/metabolite transporter (DMT)-like permease